MRLLSLVVLVLVLWMTKLVSLQIISLVEGIWDSQLLTLVLLVDLGLFDVKNNTGFIHTKSVKVINWFWFFPWFWN